MCVPFLIVFSARTARIQGEAGNGSLTTRQANCYLPVARAVHFLQLCIAALKHRHRAAEFLL
jgi:hypothetical protein